MRQINESAAQSLQEAGEQLLTLHRLGIPELLRHSTNPIESMFSTVLNCEKNIKRYRASKMSQRWLAATLRHAEVGFKLVKGYQSIPEVMKSIQCQKNQEIELAAV